MSNKDNTRTTIANYRGEIRTQVTEKTIKKAVIKAEKIMKRAAKHQKDKGTIITQDTTRAQLGNLVMGERSQEISSGQIPR